MDIIRDTPTRRRFCQDDAAPDPTLAPAPPARLGAVPHENIFCFF